MNTPMKLSEKEKLREDFLQLSFYFYGNIPDCDGFCIWNFKDRNLSRTNINNRSENIKNVRMAINSIGREAVNAGLGYNRIGGTVPDDFSTYNFGMPPDEDFDNDLLTAISAGFNIGPSKLSLNGQKMMLSLLPFVIFNSITAFPSRLKMSRKRRPLDSNYSRWCLRQLPSV